MSDVAAIEQLVKDYKSLKQEIHRVIVGQEEVVDQVLISIFSSESPSERISLKMFHLSEIVT